LILVVSNRDDLTADWLILELEQRAVPFTRFNTEDYPELVRLIWRDGEATFVFGDRTLPLSDVGAIWFRRPVLPRLTSVPPERQEWAAREAREALDGVWRTYTGRFVNRPERNQLASVKPEQLVRARVHGFRVPQTLVTNDPAAATSFLNTQSRAICKPLYSGRVTSGEEEGLFFTTLLDDKSRRAVEALGPEPYLFQELIEKQYDVRVTVIGDEAFAARIDSQADPDARVDWRKGQPGAAPHSIELLAGDVAERCVGLVRDYGLSFAAIDLARAEDGGFVFFEINPNGQWAWVEQLTGLPLRARLADLLLGA
jgi:hypothetical protein